MSAPGYQISRDPTAVVGSRFAAWLLELLLFVVIMLFLGPTPLSPLAEYVEVPAGIDRTEACDRLGDIEDVGGCLPINDRVYFTDQTDSAVQGIVVLVYFVLVYVLWQGTKGLTPGKVVLGLRTVDENGQSPGIAKAFVRSVLWIIDGFLFGLIGLIVAITSTGHRRVGDLAAKTYVVGKADAGRPIIVPGATPAAGAYGVQDGYGSGGYPQQPGAGGWGAQPAGAPGTNWGAGTPSGQGYPQAAPTAPPTAPGGPSYGAPAAPAAYPAPGAAPATGEYTAVPTGPTAPAAPPAPAAPAAPAPAPAPPASAFDESSDPADSDAPADEVAAPSTEHSASSSTEAPKADEPSSGETPAAEAADSSAPAGPSSDAPAATEPAPAPTVAANAPPTAAAPPAAAAPAAAGAEQAYNPQWDAARGAYIQWDPNRSRWLQWDDTAKEWKPI